MKSEIGQALFEAQLGDHPHNVNLLKDLRGVLEIRDNHDSDTYHAVHTVRFEGVLTVLHAFQKKSTRAIATPKRHMDLVKQRLRDAEAIHKATRESTITKTKRKSPPVHEVGSGNISPISACPTPRSISSRLL